MSTRSPFFLILTICILNNCTTPSILVTQEQQKGDASFNSHDYEPAIQHYSAMLEASTRLGVYRNLTMEGEVHRKIANCHEMLGRYPQALEHVRSAYQLDSVSDNPLYLIEDIRQEGMIHLYMGDYNKGIASLMRSLELNKGMEESLKNTSRLSIADTYLALGRAQASLGQFDFALNNLRKSNALYQDARSGEGEMESWLAMARLYSDLGDLDFSRSFTERSRMMAVELEMSTARHEQNLALIASGLGMYEPALRHQEKALQEAKRYQISGQIIWFTIGMGDIYKEIGDLDRAERYYREAQSIKDTISMQSTSMDASLDIRQGNIAGAIDYYSRQGALVGSGISALRMAEIYALKEEADSAAFYYKQAAGWFRSAGNKMGFSRAKLHLGQIYIDQDKLLDARQSLDSAEASGDYPETLWQVWFHRGRLMEKLGRREEARKAYEEAIVIIENIRGNLTIDEFRSSYIENKREVYERLINLLQEMGEPEEAFRYSERAKARAFLDMLANKKIEFRKSDKNELVKLEQEKRFQIRNMYRLLQSQDLAINSEGSSRNADTRMIREELRNSQEEYQDILLQIKLHNPEYSQMVNIEPVDLEEIQKSLDHTSAILAYWLGDKEVHAWMISRDKFVKHVTGIDRAKMEKLIENTRMSISSNSKTRAHQDLSELYTFLVEPLESEIRGLTRLVIIPNASLHFIPFQALLNDQGKFLVEDYEISYAPSASVYMLCMDRERIPGNNFLGMALGDLSIGDFSGLPGTENELNRILEQYPGSKTSFNGLQCTEREIKQASSDKQYLHLATHGSYNYTQPLYSFLLFNPSEEDDGRLTVHEVFELSLNSNLVTLSACETGLGNINQGDELLGLSRAFIYAGSASVIVSLWSVADYQTSLLMSAFYTYLKDHSSGTAMTLAQRDLIKQFPDPFYWAPFILVGNGSIGMD